MLIGLIGEKLGGKDTVAEYLVRRYGAEHIRTSHILDELLTVLGLPLTRRNEIDIGVALEKMFGNHILGQALEDRIKHSNAEIIINNGLRQEYQFNQARAMGVKILYVTSPAELRYRRSQQQATEKDKGQTFEQFVAQEQEWIEKEIPRLGKLTDFTIENTGTLEELYGKIDEIMKQITGKNNL